MNQPTQHHEAPRADAQASHDQAPPHAAAAPHGTANGTDRFLEQLQQVARTAWDATLRLVRIGNRRRLTLRSRSGEVWVRLPMTLVVLLALLLVPYWPLLVVLIVIGFAVGAQASVERVAAAAAPDEPHVPNGTA